MAVSRYNIVLLIADLTYTSKMLANLNKPAVYVFDFVSIIELIIYFALAFDIAFLLILGITMLQKKALVHQ